MAIWFHAENDLERLNELGRTCMHGHVGLEITVIGEDWLKARMPVDKRTKQPYGLLHGGASALLAESTASVAGSLTIDLNKARVFGVEINANHLRSARDGFVHAIARPESLGRRIQVWSIRITDDTDRLICLSRMTLIVVPCDPKN